MDHAVALRRFSNEPETTGASFNETALELAGIYIDPDEYERL